MWSSVGCAATVGATPSNGAFLSARLIFLDVDGTLVNESGRVPESARTAIRQARSKGHKVFICTGRSTADLWPEILDVGFDGIIAGAGAYVEVEGTVLSQRRIPPDTVHEFVSYLAAHDGYYLLESTEGVFGSSGVLGLLRGMLDDPELTENGRLDLDAALAPYIEQMQEASDVAAIPVHKISFLVRGQSLEQIQSTAGPNYVILPSISHIFGPDSAELSMAGVNKATAVQEVVAHLRRGLSATIAIGDSHNDVEMLALVGVGIAMSGAPAEVLAAANETTSGVEDHGIRNAFERHGLVSG